ncbi:MAG: ROK family protein, partial [Candidatus Zixiibacteriota bacterium]
MGVDIGGTGIKAGLVDINKGVVTGETVYEPTPQPAHPDDTVAAVARVVEQFGWRGRIGIGYPGVVKQGVALSAANLTDNWLEQNLQELFGVVTNDEVVVLNDADAAGLAEMQFGAGKDHFNPNGGLVFMCTFGTGIGSALFYHGIL